MPWIVSRDNVIVINCGLLILTFFMVYSIGYQCGRKPETKPVRAVITTEQVNSLHAGQTLAEVKEILGEPSGFLVVGEVIDYGTGLYEWKGRNDLPKINIKFNGGLSAVVDVNMFEKD